MKTYQVGSLIFFLFAPLLIDGTLKLAFSLSKKNKDMKEIEKLASHYDLNRSDRFILSKNGQKNSSTLLAFGFKIQRRLGFNFVFIHSFPEKLLFRPNLGKNALISTVARKLHVKRKGDYYFGTMKNLLKFGKLAGFLFDYIFVLMAEEN